MGKESAALKELFRVLKDHKNLFTDDLVNSSYKYCYRDEFGSFVGESDSVDLAEKLFQEKNRLKNR